MSHILHRCWRKAAMRIARDDEGGSIILIALSITAVIGFSGLATEAGSWYLTKRTMQGAADSAAYGAAVAVTNGASTSARNTEAYTAAAKYGFVNGVNGVVVAVNSPPTSGSYTSYTNAVEVLIQRPQTRLISNLFLTSDPTIAARAVATPGGGPFCVLALDRTVAGALNGGGTTNVNLVNCGIADDSNNASALSVSGGAVITADSVRVVGGISQSSGGVVNVTGTPPYPVTHSAYISDPYANVPAPTYSGCNQNNPSPVHGNVTWDAGGGTYVICGGVTVNGGGTLTLRNGVFVFDRGSLSVAGGATLNVTNATVYLTSSTGSNWATITINGGATLNATAPTTGTYAGIAFFGARNAPMANQKFNGGSSQTITGAVYFPAQTVLYTGGVTTGTGCTQVIADTISFSGNSTVESDCTGTGVKTAYAPTTLVE